MSAYLDELYFDWLYGQICSVKQRNPSHTYLNLFRMLYTKEFVWIIPNDDNRVEDGKDLRLEFLRTQTAPFEEGWVHLGCSMLEMMMALSRRAAFETSSDPADWFWEIIENLNLKCNDRDPYDIRKAEMVLDRLTWRTYSRNGRGGMFPLSKPKEDQRDVEIWYQWCAYVIERS